MRTQSNFGAFTLSVKKSIQSGNIYAHVNSVAKSGMSRRISFFRVNNNKQIENVTAQIAWLSGHVTEGEYKQGTHYMQDDGLKVDGCGMDMIMHTLYSAMPYDEAKEWNQKYNTL